MTTARGRHGARRLLVQALYQKQVGGHDDASLRLQFYESDEFAEIDDEFFRDILDEVLKDWEVLDQHIDTLADRPISQLDPIERAVLWVGFAELRSHPDVPAKVAINEAVELAKEFGTEDSFRYINAILDKASGDLR